MDGLISQGLTFLLGIGVVGVFVIKYASKARKVVTALKESLDVIEKVIVAAEDKTVTEAEFGFIIQEVKEAKKAWMELAEKA